MQLFKDRFRELFIHSSEESLVFYIQILSKNVNNFEFYFTVNDWMFSFVEDY